MNVAYLAFSGDFALKCTEVMMHERNVFCAVVTSLFCFCSAGGHAQFDIGNGATEFSISVVLHMHTMQVLHVF